MIHITQEQFEHLQKLSNVKIDSSQQEDFLKKLDSIIAKLDELGKMDLSDFDDNISIKNTLRTLKQTKDFWNKKELIKNSKHEIINNSIVIKSVLS